MKMAHVVTEMSALPQTAHFAMILHLLAYFILVMQDLPAHSTGKTCIAYRLTT